MSNNTETLRAADEALKAENGTLELRMKLLSEAIRRAPMTKPEGLSPEWQAYFDAVTPLHVADLIAALEQAQQESKEQSARIAELESQRQLAFMACNRWRDKCAELEARPLCVKLRKYNVSEVMLISGFDRQYAEGWCAGNDNAIHEIRAAGGAVEGSE